MIFFIQIPEAVTRYAFWPLRTEEELISAFHDFSDGFINEYEFELMILIEFYRYAMSEPIVYR
jgi:hypothetical protein